MQIVEAVKKELKLSKLDVVLTPVTSSTRIPLLANETIDLECGSTTNNVERQKQVAYTNTHFVTASRFVSKKSSSVNKIEDLKGKTIVSTAGSTNIKQANEVNAAKGLGMTIIAAKDHSDAFLMVETDRAVAFVMDDIIIAGLVASSKQPGNYKISDDAFSAGALRDHAAQDDAPVQEIGGRNDQGSVYVCRISGTLRKMVYQSNSRPETLISTFRWRDH